MTLRVLCFLCTVLAVANEAAWARTKRANPSPKAPAASTTQAAATPTVPAAASPSASAPDAKPPATREPVGPSPDSAATGPANPGASPGTGPSPTETASRPKTKAEVEAALAEASALFKAGQHVQAADKLMAVYQSSPQPIYLFNAGQAYRRAKLPVQAKGAYQRFLDTAPTHPLAPEVRGYVRDMQTLEEMQRHEQQISLQLQQEKAEATSARQALLQEKSTPIYKRPLFWGLMAGVSLAVFSGAIVLGVIRERANADYQLELSR